ncbi:hypothetical protein DPMN_190094 [Dreissena polymorpha]|uniref:Uncharacterized protein n=1 Tax=Dreissena polymorpha TaxID=45954 RepID=A0A9D4DUB8_DREPO|nr:hypothetical protein DPMN_190094 [Dreissena polymorpha]
MSMSDLARHSPQLDIRAFCRMSMSKLARHSSQLDIRDFCRMSLSELARHTPQFDIRMSMAVPTSRSSKRNNQNGTCDIHDLLLLF